MSDIAAALDSGCDECGGSGIANPAVRAQMTADFRAPIPSADGGGQWTPTPEAPTCTEAAPCFACLRCLRTLTNILATDPNVRAHMTGVETRPAWKPAWKRAAEAGGTLPSADAYRIGPLSAERTITLTSPHVATLPTGERVELPAGTVLREDTRPPPIKLASAEEERAILPRLVGYEIREERGKRPRVLVTDVDGREIELMRVSPAEVLGEHERRHETLGEQLLAEHEGTGATQTAIDARTAAEMMRPLYEGAGLCAGSVVRVGPNPILADLTERAGLPREMAPSVEPDPLNPAEPWTCADDAKLARDIAHAGRPRT